MKTISLDPENSSPKAAVWKKLLQAEQKSGW
jgi:hypothetical protein